MEISRGYVPDDGSAGGATKPQTMTNQKKEWEKVLEQHIKFCFGGEYGDTPEDAVNIMTAFITNLLASHNNSLVALLEEKKWPLKRDETNEYYKIQRSARNQALTESQELIKNSLT